MSINNLEKLWFSSFKYEFFFLINMRAIKGQSLNCFFDV